jgi:transposase
MELSVFFAESFRQVFIYKEPVDMRKGVNGFSYLITHQINLDLLSGSVFLFVSKNRKIAKAIVWDGTGLMLVYKRLERGRFMSFEALQEVHEIKRSDLCLILSGAKVPLDLKLRV